MIDALQGGLSIGCFVLGIYLPIALFRKGMEWLK